LSKAIIPRLVIGVVHFLGFVLFSLPRPWSILLGHGLGRILMSFGYRKTVIHENLKRLYPEVSPLLLKNVYHEIGKLFSELLLIVGGMKWFALKYAKICGHENWKLAKVDATKKGTGVILISHHAGNWEVMLARGALAGIDIMMVTKHLKPQWIHDAIERGRMSCGIQATYEPKTLKDVLSHLKKSGTVGFVLDQYSGPPVGIRVPFFGIPVGTASIVATLVKRTGAPVLLASNYRTADGHFIVQISPPIPWQEHADPKMELALNTARYTEQIEMSVREHPEQWLWAHRRFKGDLSPLKDNEWMHGRTRH